MLIKRIINHESLEYFIIIKKLTRCQVCKVKNLSKFNFIISYSASKDNVQVDALICHFSDSPAMIIMIGNNTYYR